MTKLRFVIVLLGVSIITGMVAEMTLSVTAAVMAAVLGVFASGGLIAYIESRWDSWE